METIYSERVSSSFSSRGRLVHDFSPPPLSQQVFKEAKAIHSLASRHPRPTRFDLERRENEVKRNLLRRRTSSTIDQTQWMKRRRRIFIRKRSSRWNFSSTTVDLVSEIDSVSMERDFLAGSGSIATGEMLDRIRVYSLDRTDSMDIH